MNDFSNIAHRLYFFRHGESVANDGKPTTDVASIELTPKGVEQARALARFFPEAPQKVIVSSFLRTRKTAELALSAFPGLSLEVWPIQEFTYLSPQRCAGTTNLERLPWVTEYWSRADPYYRDSSTAESFQDLIARVDTTLLRIPFLLANYRFAAIFGHGIFMNALRWRANNEQEAITSSSMRSCRDYTVNAPIENGMGFRCELAAGRMHFFDIV